MTEMLPRVRDHEKFPIIVIVKTKNSSQHIQFIESNTVII